jgi:hypothetical protein
VLSIAATALMVGLTVAAQAGVSHAPTHPPLAGITFNGLDQARGTGAAAAPVDGEVGTKISSELGLPGRAFHPVWHCFFSGFGIRRLRAAVPAAVGFRLSGHGG